METVCVYGPTGVGKTLNRELIAEFLNCDTIVDHSCCSLLGTHRVLLLKQEKPGPEFDYDQAFQLADIRKFILNHPYYADRWVEPEKAQKIAPIGEVDPRVQAVEETVAKLEPERWRPLLGDVVRLKSCTQGMTVVSDCCCGPVDVSWFDGTTLQTETFPIECLATGDRDDPIPF